jgi:hypothetical protein
LKDKNNLLEAYLEASEAHLEVSRWMRGWLVFCNAFWSMVNAACFFASLETIETEGLIVHMRE